MANKRFLAGDLVKFEMPSEATLRYFGLRVYTVDRPYRRTNAPYNSFGIIVSDEHWTSEDALVMFYKVLIDEKVLWIASRHLRLVKQRNI